MTIDLEKEAKNKQLSVCGLTYDELYKLLEAQNSLNENYVKNWIYNTDLFALYAAYETEFSEFLESSPQFGNWKYWKKYLKDDKQNGIIEIIDMLHFGLSLVMKQHFLDAEDLDAYDTLKEEYQTQKITNEHLDAIITECAENIKDTFNFETFGDLEGAFETKADFYYSGFQLDDLLLNISLLAKYYDKTLKDIYSGYFLKNELNLHRIQNGYLEGTYQKVDENGNEDNRKLEVE